MTESTKITYDISDAIAKLNELNKKVGEAGDTAVRAFTNAGGRALDSFVDGLSEISPVAGRAVGGIRTLAGSLGPMGAVAGTAAAGLAAIVSNLIDLPNLLSDSVGQMEAFNKAADRQLDIFENFDDIGDAIEKSANRRALRELNLKQAEIGREQARLSNLKAASLEELEIARNTVREKEDLIRDSIKRREDLEKQLALGTNATRVDQVERGSRTKEQSVGNLAAAAQKAAFEGNVDLAEELRDRAQQISDELGGHVFFQKQVDQATGAITASMQKQIKAESQIQSGLQQEYALAKQVADQREREVDLLKERERLLRVETKEVRAARRDIAERETRREQTDIADRGAGEVITGIAKIRAEFEIGGRTVAENIKDSLRLTLGGLSSKARVDAGIATEGDALKLVEQISRVLTKPEGVTTAEVQNIQPLVQQLGALTSALEVERGAGRLNQGQERGLQQLERFIADFNQVAGGAAKFAGADRDPNEIIRRDSEGILVTPANRLNDAATNLDRAASKLAGIPTAATTIPQNTNQPVPVGAVPSTPSNITVNANVKGGIIDREVTEQIIDIIQRELRKQTGKSGA